MIGSIIGYGLRKKGDLNKSNLPCSFDLFFYDEDDFDSFYDNIDESDFYKIYNNVKTVIFDDIVRELRDESYSNEDIIKYFNNNTSYLIDEGDLESIL